MTYDFSREKKVKIDIIDYMNTMVDNFSTNLKPNNTCLDLETVYLFAAEEIEKQIKNKYR